MPFSQVICSSLPSGCIVFGLALFLQSWLFTSTWRQSTGQLLSCLDFFADCCQRTTAKGFLKLRPSLGQLKSWHLKQPTFNQVLKSLCLSLCQQYQTLAYTFILLLSHIWRGFLDPIGYRFWYASIKTASTSSQQHQVTTSPPLQSTLLFYTMCPFCPLLLCSVFYMLIESYAKVHCCFGFSCLQSLFISQCTATLCLNRYLVCCISSY